MNSKSPEIHIAVDNTTIQNLANQGFKTRFPAVGGETGTIEQGGKTVVAKPPQRIPKPH